MKFTRIAVVAAVVICTALQLVAPAFGWYWPIMGFSTGFAPNLAPGPHLPSPQDQMLPGTTQWGYPPIDRAQMVSPGAAYGPHPFNGTLNFGSALPFGLIKRTVSAPESAEAALTGRIIRPLKARIQPLKWEIHPLRSRIIRSRECPGCPAASPAGCHRTETVTVIAAGQR